MLPCCFRSSRPPFDLQNTVARRNGRSDGSVRWMPPLNAYALAEDTKSIPASMGPHDDGSLSDLLSAEPVSEERQTTQTRESRPQQAAAKGKNLPEGKQRRVEGEKATFCVAPFHHTCGGSTGPATSPPQSSSARYRAGLPGRSGGGRWSWVHQLDLDARTLAVVPTLLGYETGDNAILGYQRV